MKMKKLDTVEIIKLFFLLVLLAVFIWCLVYFAKPFFYKETTGTLVSCSSEPVINDSDSGIMYEGTYEFYVSDKRFETKYQVAKNQCNKGQTINIYYDLNNPDINTNIKSPLSLLFIFFIDVLLVYLIYLWFKVKLKTDKKRKE